MDCVCRQTKRPTETGKKAEGLNFREFRQITAAAALPACQADDHHPKHKQQQTATTTTTTTTSFWPSGGRAFSARDFHFHPFSLLRLREDNPLLAKILLENLQQGEGKHSTLASFSPSPSPSPTPVACSFPSFSLSLSSLFQCCLSFFSLSNG